MPTRCPWSESSDLMLQYHDTEWGTPLHDDVKLFEFFVLDAFQAGLSWATIINKRENFRRAFDNFQPEIIAKYTPAKVQELLSNTGIIRNKLKIEASINNARNFLDIQQEYGSFDKYIWQFTDHKSLVNKWSDIAEVPSRSEKSDRMSKDLKSKGFKFVGSTICYSFMQASGMINDHLISCFRYDQI
jgi:DNA-3-methyladenine glycosylase I